MDNLNVDFDDGREIVTLTSGEWTHTSDQFVTMTYNEYECWLQCQLMEVRQRIDKKNTDVSREASLK